MDFLNFKISTLAGIIILLLVSFAFGLAIYHQMNQIMAIRIEAIEEIK